MDSWNHEYGINIFKKASNGNPRFYNSIEGNPPTHPIPIPTPASAPCKRRVDLELMQAQHQQFKRLLRHSRDLDRDRERYPGAPPVQVAAWTDNAQIGRE